MGPNATFKSLNFNPFIVNDSLNENNQDPVVNFFHDNVSPLDTDYISQRDFNGNIKDLRKIHSLFYISISGVLLKILNLLENSVNR